MRRRTREAQGGSDANRPDELERVGRVYAGYRRSDRRRRAWAAHNAGNVAIREELLNVCWGVIGAKLTSGGELLDAGCGTGFWLSALAEYGASPERLHGVELLPERLAAARDRVPREVRLRQGDLRRLPYVDAAFDVVLLFTVLSSLRDQQDVRTALREASRVTRLRGAVLIYEPRFPNPLNRHTGWIPASVFRETLGPVEERPVTVWPPIARRLGPLTGALYARLAGKRWATSHRLLVYRRL